MWYWTCIMYPCSLELLKSDWLDPKTEQPDHICKRGINHQSWSSGPSPLTFFITTLVAFDLLRANVSYGLFWGEGGDHFWLMMEPVPGRQWSLCLRMEPVSMKLWQNPCLESDRALSGDMSVAFVLVLLFMNVCEIATKKWQKGPDFKALDKFSLSRY